MQIYATAVGLSVLGSLGGLLTASTFLLLGDHLRVKLVPWLISYAVGTLLGVALLALLPEALEQIPPTHALGTLLVGVLAFFLLEKLVLWRHCHDTHDCEVHTSSAASLVIVGDAFHTFVDGAVIAAAVITSVPLGITTALAVAAHEIPQEVGDVAILLRAGFSKLRAFTLNLLSGIGGHPRRGGDARRLAVRSRTCSRTCCRSRPAISSTSPWPTSSPTCIAAASAAVPSGSSSSSSPGWRRSRCCKTSSVDRRVDLSPVDCPRLSPFAGSAFLHLSADSVLALPLPLTSECEALPEARDRP